MTTIFISYRRSDSQVQTRRLYDRLAKDFGRDNVFIDIDSMPLGNDFPTVLDHVLSQSRIVLVVIGPSWANVTESDGAKRLYNPQDFVRLEVEAALQREIAVVPVLVAGAALPDARKLPATLRGLCRRNAIEVGDDPRFDGDVERLVRGLKRLLVEGLVELPAEGPAQPAKEDETEVVGHDREFPSIDEQIATGSKFIVLVGPTGIGKTVTALELARRHTPPDSGRRNILRIDAREEFHEASLAEAVGEAFPGEYYRDHDGAPFSALSFGAQRHVAAGLLKRKRATVILDGPGDAPYPRDAATEMELALRVAKELTAQSVLVLVTTRNESWWAAFHPIHLRGLSPENARALFRREFLRCSPSSSPNDVLHRLDREDALRKRIDQGRQSKRLTNYLSALGGREDALRKRIEQGRPGELIDAAQQTAVGAPAKEQTSPGVLGRTTDSLRRAAETLFGDPVLLPPRAPAAKAAVSGPLAVVCVVLLLVSFMSLIAAYESHSVLWARMFDQMPTQEIQVPSLADAAAHAGGPTPGLLVEFARAVIIIFGFLFVIAGRFLGKEAAALLPHSPWARFGPRRLGLRSLFRIFALVLAAWLAETTIVHHLSRGPRILWMCNGNPLLQDCLDSNDQNALKKHQEKPAEAPDRMNGEPPSEGEPGYADYWWQCVLPYRLYFGYSFIMYVIVVPAVLTVGFYTVVSSLANHLIAQPKLIRELRDDAILEVIDNRLRYCKKTYVEDIDRYLAILLVVLGFWAYNLWWDQYNMTGTAVAEAKRLIVVVLCTWGALIAVLLLTYQALVQEAVKRIPEGPAHDAFHRRHASFRFFLKTVLESAYFWLCLVAGGAAASWHLFAALGGWQR